MQVLVLGTTDLSSIDGSHSKVAKKKFLLTLAKKKPWLQCDSEGDTATSPYIRISLKKFMNLCNLTEKARLV